jgi:hypothetical protein
VEISIPTLIARFFSVSLFLVGLSHVIQPRLWRDFFLKIKGTGVAGLIIAMYTLPQGLLIVLGHNIWVLDIPVIITICGWGMTIKSILYALLPNRAEAVIPEGPNAHLKYARGGALMIPVSLLLIWHSFFRAV